MSEEKLYIKAFYWKELGAPQEMVEMVLWLSRSSPHNPHTLTISQQTKEEKRSEAKANRDFTNSKKKNRKSKV